MKDFEIYIVKVWQYLVTSYTDFKSFSRSRVEGFQKKHQSHYLYYTNRHSSWTY